MKLKRLILLFFLLLVPASDAFAGWLLAPSAKWSNFVMRPEEAEPTPNYYGVGPGLSFGYSIRQIMDTAINFQYVPGAFSKAKIGEEDASLYFLGAELGLRIREAVYVGLRAGKGRYKLLRRTEDTEIPGLWSGTGTGVSIGAIRRINKRNFVQISLEFLHVGMAREDEAVEGERSLDCFSVGVTYVFNSFSNYAIDNTFFKSFLDSVLFF